MSSLFTKGEEDSPVARQTLRPVIGTRSHIHQMSLSVTLLIFFSGATRTGIVAANLLGDMHRLGFSRLGGMLLGCFTVNRFLVGLETHPHG